MTVTMRRLRLGLLLGFAIGYYLGSMAGRERYDQINRLVRKVKGSDAYELATDKAKAVVDLGVERAKDLVDRNGTTTNGTTVKVEAPDLGGAPAPF